MSEYNIFEKAERADWNQKLYGRMIYELQRNETNYEQLDFYEKVQKRWIRIRNTYIKQMYNKYINKGCCCTSQNK